MIVLLAQTHPPTAIDTTEALCDAILRNDVQTQNSLMTMDSIPTTMVRALGALKNDHLETATSYNAKIIKEWDDPDASFVIVAVPLESDDESLNFTCRYVVNQWTIVSIQLSSPKIHVE